MTRKDFQLIADALKASKPTAGGDSATIQHGQWVRTVCAMRDSLRTTNDKFDGARFTTAAGLLPND